jgi:integrase
MRERSGVTFDWFERAAGRRPEQLTYEDVRRFQLQPMQSGLAPGTVNSAMVGLRFFFRTTLRRPQALDYIPMAREPQRLPVVLTPDEVASLLESAPGLKWRTALSVAYGAGLRASEVVGLKVSDIDSQRMRIRVEQGKGGATATRCSRPVCWGCCATGGRWRGRRSGCFPTG